MNSFKDFFIMAVKIVFYVFSFYAFYWIFGPEINMWWIVVYGLFIACGDMGIKAATFQEGSKR